MGAAEVVVVDDSCNSGELTFGERDSWSDTDSWDYAEYKAAARAVVVSVGKLELRIEESWIHQSSSGRCRKWQTELELELEVEAVADNWNGCKAMVESILLLPGLASMADDQYCKVSADPCFHC